MTPRLRPQSRTRPSPADLGTFRRQIVGLTAGLAVLAAVGLVIIVQLALADASTNAITRVLDARSASVIRAVNDSTSGVELVVPEAQLDPGVAVYDSSGRLVGGRPPATLAGTFRDLARTPQVRYVSLEAGYRVRAQPFTSSSGAPGVVVVAERLAPYEAAERYAFVVSIAAGGIIVAIAVGLAAWVSRRALAPVAEMARTAEQWSRHDLTQRFALGPPTNEIRALGGTLDGLLDKVAQAIRSEQRITSELAHELRSPLTAVQGTAEIILMNGDLSPELREDVEEMLAGCRTMASTVTSLLELARSEAQPGAGVCDLADVIEEVCRHLPSDSSRVSTDVAPGLAVAVPLSHAVRAVSPVVENAVRFAENVAIRARANAADGTVRVLVHDDGPGVAESLRDAVFEPGRTTSGGSGLGLALARRIARGVGGDVLLIDRADGPSEPATGGAAFEIWLPGVAANTGSQPEREPKTSSRRRSGAASPGWRNHS